MTDTPKSINYGDQLPIGIESKSIRREFYPVGGSSGYSGDGNNTTTIDISHSGFIDFSNSYLSFVATNKTTHKYMYDLGQPLIKTLQVECGGNIIEKITNYNGLVGGILEPSQGGRQAMNLSSLQASSVSDRNFLVAQFTSEHPTLIQANTNIAKRNSILIPPVAIRTTDLEQPENTETKMCYKLVSGFLDNDKWCPSFLLGSPITLVITWEEANKSGCREGANLIGTGGKQIDISDVKYIAHCVDLETSFYDRLRMVQQQSGGFIQFAGVSYQGFKGTLTDGSIQSINIPARLRSIKSVFFKVGNNVGTTFGLSGGGHANIRKYSVNINGVSYPPQPISCNASGVATNLIEPYFELQKAFGKLSSTLHSDYLCDSTYLNDESGQDTHNLNAIGATFVEMDASFAPFGIDLESWRESIEGGLSTQDGKQLSLELEQSETASTLDINIWCMYDALYMISSDGSLSVSK